MFKERFDFRLFMNNENEVGKLNEMLERFLKKRMELIGCVEGEKMTSTESSSKFLSSFEDEEGEEVHPFI